MAIMLLGESVAAKIYCELKKTSGLEKLKLAVVQVGNQGASVKYIEEKKKACENLGIGFELFGYPENISQEELKEKVLALGRDPLVTGMLIQLPLPKDIQTQEILDLIPFEKDVDVLSSARLESFASSDDPLFPPTVRAISLLLKETGANLKEKQVVVVGAGRLVGSPVMTWLSKQRIRFNLVRQSTQNKEEILKQADVIISGVGKKNLITGAMIKEGVVVIDAGKSVEAGEASGDVEQESVFRKASFLSPVPGGVGPLTVACLIDNLVSLSRA